MLSNQAVRFFVYDPEDSGNEYSEDIRETSEEEFLGFVQAGERVTYERHTVRENGVSQICLTAGLPEG